MTPYAAPQDRARALYRLLDPPPPCRTLELCWNRAPLQPGAPEQSVAIDLSKDRDASALAAASFDLVVLHRTLDDARAPQAQVLLTEAAQLLRAGGIVAGCVDNAASLWSIAARWTRRARHAAPAREGAAGLDEPGLRDALSTAGFVDPRVFALLPDADAPLRLVETDAAVFRAVLRRALSASPASPSLAVRRIALETGRYSRRFARALFFCAVKKC
jgi:hypothetical protein